MKTILIIDDEAIIRDLLNRSLKKLGYAVVSAEGGRKAVDLFARRHAEIDAVILDMRMPGMDGEETLAALRQVSPNIPVILSSGQLEEDAAILARTLNAAGYLVKPYRVKRLGEILETVLSLAVSGRE